MHHTFKINTLQCISNVLMQFSSIKQHTHTHIYIYIYIHTPTTNVQFASQTSELQLPCIIFHRPNITLLREMNQ